ncbi:hypothetical protein Bca101_077366 [Brassica carinata]
MFGLLKKSKPQQDVYFPFKTVFEKEQLIFDKKQFASNGFDFVQKQRKRQNRSDDEKLVRSGDCPFTKAKRSNRDVSNQNELQTYASLEKMLHKAIHVVRQLKKKGNTNTSSAPKQQSNSSSLSNSDLKTNVLSYDKSKAVKTTRSVIMPTSAKNRNRWFMFFTVPDLTWIMPDLTWVVKKPKTDMHSHPADHPDNPASVLIFTPCIHLVRMNLDILTSLLHFSVP